jgi:hypothetical protein
MNLADGTSGSEIRPAAALYKKGGYNFPKAIDREMQEYQARIDKARSMLKRRRHRFRPCRRRDSLPKNGRESL